MTSKSKMGGRRDNHPPSLNAENKKDKKTERIAKGKHQTKLQVASRHDAQDAMRHLSND